MATTLVEPLAGNWITSADSVKMPLFEKDPQDVLDYGFDWSNHLADDDTIVAVTFQTSNAELGVLSTNFTDTNAYVWLYGGVVEQTYLVTMHITTDKGRQHERTFAVQCGEN